MCKLLLEFPAVAINYVYSSLRSLAEGFSPFRELQGLEMYDTALLTTTTSDRIYHLNIRKQKPYKTFYIPNIES